jgi:hypothetical protein
MKCIISLSAAAILLASCSSFELSDANKLQKGMTTEQVLNTVSKGPDNIFDIRIPSRPSMQYTIYQFTLKLGGIKADYLAAFNDDKLLYWGHPYEFNRYPDPVINEIGREALIHAKL